MGMFDDLLDAIVEAPGKIAEKAVETVVRIPEVGIKTVEGVVKGAEKGIKNVEKAIDDALD